MYIYNKPQFIKTAFIYILINISIKWLFFNFIANIKYIYHISLWNFDLRYLINQYLMYINYINLCFESGKILPLIEYKRYMAWLNAVDSQTKGMEQLLREKSRLFNILKRLVSENLYICGHGSTGNPNVILRLQVSARARAMLGLNTIDQHCLRIAAVYKAINFSEHEFQVMRLCWEGERQLLAINPKYFGNIININNELMRIQVERCHLIAFSHDENEFFIVDIYRDGTLRYIYFF
jgi:hypothetical protein